VGIDPHNQNPADVPGLKADRISFRSSFSSETHASPFHARCGGSDLWRPDGERREHVPATLSRTTRGERFARRTISSKELRLEPEEKAARPRLQGWIAERHQRLERTDVGASTTVTTAARKAEMSKSRDHRLVSVLVLDVWTR